MLILRQQVIIFVFYTLKVLQTAKFILWLFVMKFSGFIKFDYLFFYLSGGIFPDSIFP